MHFDLNRFMKLRIIIILTLNYALLLTSFAQIDTILWQNCYGVFNGKNHVYAIEKTKNGYLFAIDVEENDSNITNFHGISDAWIVNTDSVGNIIWEKCYGGSQGDNPLKIIKLNEDSYYLLN